MNKEVAHLSIPSKAVASISSYCLSCPFALRLGNNLLVGVFTMLTLLISQFIGHVLTNRRQASSGKIAYCVVLLHPAEDEFQIQRWLCCCCAPCCGKAMQLALLPSYPLNPVRSPTPLCSTPPQPIAGLKFPRNRTQQTRLEIPLTPQRGAS